MRLYFRYDLFDAQLLRTVGHATYGGADLGECLTVAQSIPEKDTARWYAAWMELADRVRGQAESSLRNGHHVSARHAFLRASNYYRNAYVFLFHEPVDDALVRAYNLHRDAFRQASDLMPSGAEAVRIPYERTSLPGYFFKAPGDRPRPTLVINGGYDSTAEESYLYNAAAGIERGYHCLVFDGPGQASLLINEGLRLRHDWEAVITPIVDWLVRRPDVDSRRIAIIGESLGGYLALRAATGEPRLRACIADPGQLSLLTILRTRMPPFIYKQLPDFRGLAGSVAKALLRRQVQKPEGWVLRRGLWVHGAKTVEDYFRLLPPFTIEDRIQQIRCPTLICDSDGDILAATARQVYDLLSCEKEIVTFRTAEGAGDHCVMGARSLFHQRIFDWLDTRMKSE